jgi:hypothetical protein
LLSEFARAGECGWNGSFAIVLIRVYRGIYEMMDFHIRVLSDYKPDSAVSADLEREVWCGFGHLSDRPSAQPSRMSQTPIGYGRTSQRTLILIHRQQNDELKDIELSQPSLFYMEGSAFVAMH